MKTIPVTAELVRKLLPDFRLQMQTKGIENCGQWYTVKVANSDELADIRIKEVTADTVTVSILQVGDDLLSLKRSTATFAVEVCNTGNLRFALVSCEGEYQVHPTIEITDGYFGLSVIPAEVVAQ